MPQKGLPLRFRELYQYEREVHERVLDSLETVPADRRRDSEYRNALGLFGHLLAARRMWLFRMGQTVVGATSETELFPTGSNLEALRRRNDEVESLWRDFFSTVDHDEVGRTMTYTAFEGGSFSNSVEEVLIQLHGHSWYHRGQIASMVRRLGGEPAVTDFIFWTRRSLD